MVSITDFLNFLTLLYLFYNQGLAAEAARNNKTSLKFERNGSVIDIEHVNDLLSGVRSPKSKSIVMNKTGNIQSVDSDFEAEE